MTWIFVNIVLCLCVSGYVLTVVRKIRRTVEDAHVQNFKNLEGEYSKKKSILENLAVALPGLISAEDIEAKRGELSEFETLITTTNSKCAIAEAEIDALDIRLRELEELGRELEVSKLDALKEIEMLKAQERDMSNQNEAINTQLTNSMEQIDFLLDVLNANVEATEQLNKIRSEMLEVEKKTNYYEEEINKINQNYVGLKRAYDALDIEYAQLYEKRQQELGDGD